MSSARLAYVADLMRRFRYRRGVTSRELAAEWGLSLKRVEVYTAAASKLVRAELEDPDRVRVDVTLTLESIMRRARRAKTRTVYGKNGDAVGVEKDWAAAKVAIEAARTWAMLTGNAAPKVVEHRSEYKTPAEALADLRKVVAELEAQVAADAHVGHA